MNLPPDERLAADRLEGDLNGGDIPGRLRDLHARWLAHGSDLPFGTYVRRGHHEAFAEAVEWSQLKREKLRREHSRWGG